MIGCHCLGSAHPSGRFSTGWWQQLCEAGGPGGSAGESQPHVTLPHQLSSRFCCGFTSGQLVYIAQSVDLPWFWWCVSLGGVSKSMFCALLCTRLLTNLKKILPKIDSVGPLLFMFLQVNASSSSRHVFGPVLDWFN